MANLLLIEKQTGGYFKFTLNGDTANAVTSIYNDLLTVGNQLHFKTGNGANIIKEQFIYPEDVTVIASGTFTFTTVAQVWDKLIDIDYFAWLGNGGGGGGVDRFDDLVDTFKYTGNAGKTVIVDNSELRLVPVTLYNKRLFTELEDTPSSLVPNKMLVVNPAGTAVVLQDQPEAPEALLNSVGYFDYNDLITQTIPLVAIANTPLKLTNDSEGANTSTDQNPYGVSYVWDYTTNQFNFSELSVGDTIDVRIHVQITTTSANQKVSMSAKFGIGSVSEFTNAIYENQFKTAGLHEVSFVAPFYMGSEYITDYPAELYLTTDASATVKVDGWYIRILRKNINVITVDYTVPDATTLAKGIVRLAGDLAGTANAPTVPELANKVPNTRTVSTTSPLLGGGALSSDLTLSIQQANSTQSGFISYVDWANFEAKQSALSGTGFVKVSGSTVYYDNNTYSLDSDVVKLTGNQTIDGIKTFTDYTKFTDSSATGGLWAVEIDVNSNDALVVKDGGTVRFQIGRNGEALGQKYKVSGGFSNQFLKANGDLDSNTYALDSGVVKLTGNQTIAGQKTFANTIYAIGGTGSGEYAIEIDKSFEGEAIRVKNATSTTFTLSLGGTVTASSYVKSGGTSSQFLKADGSVDSSTYQPLLTNPITGTGTTNYVPKFTGTSALGNSLIYDNGTNVFVGGSGSNGNRFTVVEGGTTLVGQQILMQSASSSNDALNIVHSGTGKLIKGTKGVEVFNITNSGGAYFADSVGIGITPSAWDTGLWKVLQLSYGSLYSSIYSNVMAHNLYVAGEDTKYISSNFATQYEQNSGAHWWYTAPTGTAGANVTLTPRMILDNSGNLGIGTTPQVSTHIYTSTSRAIPALGDAGGHFIIQTGGVIATVMGINANGNFYLQPQHINGGGSTVYNTLLNPSGGGVGIGINYSPSVKLQIGQTASGTTNNFTQLITSSDGGKGLYQGFDITNRRFYWRKNDSDDYSFSWQKGDGTNMMLITSGGDVNLTTLGTGLVYSNGGTLQSTNPSDSRLKDDITDLQYGLNEILQLRPVSYNWKNDTINQGKQFGFIAQEVQEIMPELISEFTTTEDEEEVVRLGLDKEGIYATLVNAIKELKAEIEILKNK